MTLLIDPPVGPLHSRARLQAWVDELQKMRAEYESDPEALAEVDHQLARARAWLEAAPA